VTVIVTVFGAVFVVLELVGGPVVPPHAVTSTWRLRKIHDRIGGKSEENRTCPNEQPKLY
jgi:hypothetical protein